MSTNQSTATYVFAVCRGCEPAALTGLAGHEAAVSVRLLPVGSLQAVVQDVPEAAFGEQALHARLSDREGLELFARTHHAVVCAVARCAATLPLPLATVYHGDDRAVAALTSDQARFHAALDRVEGREEWGVKVHTVPGAALATASAADQGSVAPAAGSGRAYLDLVRGRQRARQQRREASLQAARAVDLTLRDLSVATRRLRTHGSEATGPDRTQLLNAAYLVTRGRGDQLAAAVDRLRREPHLEGVEIDVSGPWPAYSFVDSEDTDDHT
ncbi:GvpL/GvpF family gas vesicle protein [Streptomyces sp. NA04227]|nr:GvpL/GvpF family gas vesicle protein [Streptomyces sp. NA04227]